jgi:single-stranded-DNA-specific exonuclease
LQQKKWEVAPEMPAAQAEQFPALPPLLLQVLYNRDLKEPSEVEGFMSGTWQEPDLYLLPDMERAVDILIRAIRRREKIAVYGDFDADGVTATALLVRALAGVGADVIPYIPRRVDEGYGVNLDALRRLYGEQVRLVVTVDCGIRAVQEIDQARRGLEFIITDHHSVGRELPFASAVIDPKRADSRYPFPQLSGVGVAYKLAQALLREAGACKMPVHVEERSLLDLVAIGTVADLAPLTGENRHLVQLGLEVVNEARREGVRALLRVAGVRPGAVSASSIGFVLGPRLNAAGRLGDATLSYDLLVSADPVQADRLAARLNEQNRRRRALTEQAYQLAVQLALAREGAPALLFAAHKTFMAGVVGLVAGRLTEAYYRPSVVVEQGDEISKGSCRSIEEFDITAALDECSDLLVRHGGHAAAAGFRVRNEQLDGLVHRLSEIAERELGDRILAPTLSIDADVPLSDMNWEMMGWLEQLEPCGIKNPTPLFLSRGVPVAEARAVGSEGKHLKLTLATEAEAQDAIAFRLGHRVDEVGQRMDLVYYLEVNEWNGSRSLQLNVQDFRPVTP